MICEGYKELTVKEQYEFIGKLIHIAINDERMFRSLSSIVRQAENNGLLNNVKILPEEIERN